MTSNAMSHLPDMSHITNISLDGIPSIEELSNLSTLVRRSVDYIDTDAIADAAEDARDFVDDQADRGTEWVIL